MYTTGIHIFRCMGSYRRRSSMLRRIGSSAALVAASAATAAAVDALNDSLIWWKFVFGYSANAGCSEICTGGLNASQTAKSFKSLLSPFCNQPSIRPTLSHAVIVELSGNGLPFVVTLVDIPGALMMELKDRPRCLALTFPFMRLVLYFSHLPLKLQQRRRDQVPSLWWLLAAAQTYARHCQNPKP